MKKEIPKKVAIASCTPEATEAAAEIVKQGGNAFDAAVACAFNLFVSNVLMCSPGGGGFATIKLPGKEPVVLDFFDAMPGKGLSKDQFGRSPQKVTLPYGIGIDVIIGYNTIGVPGSTRGLEYISKNYGNLPLKELLKPAIDLARAGMPVNSTISKWLNISAEKLHWYTEYSKSILSTEDGKVPQAGFVLKNPDLANTLELIGQKGTDIIYGGEIGEQISKFVRKSCGLITLEDLKNYRVIERKPLRTKYDRYEIFTNPPPSVGGITLVQMLKAISRINFDGYTPDIVSKLGQIIYTALNDRYSIFEKGVRDFDQLYSIVEDDYVHEKYKNILPCPNTTHLSCVDDLGNACSLTMSMGYGSGVAVPETGIFFDNVLGELELNPLGFHALEPGQRLVSGMAPTIAVNPYENDVFVLGSPGASRIAPAIFQMILNTTKLNLPIDKAITLPRVHWEEGKLVYEAPLEPDMLSVPDEWDVVQFEDIDMYFGGVQCTRFFEKNKLTAASDPRRNGKSIIVESSG